MKEPSSRHETYHSSKLCLLEHIVRHANRSKKHKTSSIDPISIGRVTLPTRARANTQSDSKRDIPSKTSSMHSAVHFTTELISTKEFSSISKLQLSGTGVVSIEQLSCFFLQKVKQHIRRSILAPMIIALCEDLCP